LVQDDDDYPFTAWDDLKFTVGGLLLLLSPLFFLALLALIVHGLFF
jgi:hypothetical protein